MNDLSQPAEYLYHILKRRSQTAKPLVSQPIWQSWQSKIMSMSNEASGRGVHSQIRSSTFQKRQSHENNMKPPRNGILIGCRTWYCNCFCALLGCCSIFEILDFAAKVRTITDETQHQLLAWSFPATPLSDPKTSDTTEGECGSEEEERKMAHLMQYRMKSRRHDERQKSVRQGVCRQAWGPKLPFRRGGGGRDQM